MLLAGDNQGRASPERGGKSFLQEGRRMNEGLSPVKIQATEPKPDFLKSQEKKVTFRITALEIKVSKEIIVSICVEFIHQTLPRQP